MNFHLRLSDTDFITSVMKLPTCFSGVQRMLYLNPKLALLPDDTTSVLHELVIVICVSFFGDRGEEASMKN